MKRLISVVILCSLTGCCTYQHKVDIDNNQVKKEKADSNYKKCLAHELLQTIKFWVGMQR